jgi:hypothetical protein
MSASRLSALDSRITRRDCLDALLVGSGFFFGRDGQPAPGEVLRPNPVGRIAFANSDLSGVMDHRASIGDATRAVDQAAAFS